MAKEFLIGEIGSETYDGTNNTLADTGLNIEFIDPATGKVDSWSGALATANPVPDAVRIVQGKGVAGVSNVNSSWFSPRNILAYDGSKGATAKAGSIELDIAGDCTVAGVLDLKFVLENGSTGLDQFFHLSVDITAVADDAIDALIKTAYNAAVKPEWLFHKAALSGDTLGTDAPAAVNGGILATATDRIYFHGNISGATTTSSGREWDGDASRINLIVEANTATGPVFTPQTKASGRNGIGTYYQVKAMEDAMMGINYGYYNRRNLPNTPANSAVDAGIAAVNYNHVSLIISRDGSTSVGQIKGVDNLIELKVAMKTGGANLFLAASTDFLSKLNLLTGNAGSFNSLTLG
tara:strand:- start:598 stop:1650 length:1053 start_codon:yes stop_codon:yes gene_type:complete